MDDVFHKSIWDQLQVSDLERLIQDEVAEGYFVEYKEQFTTSEKIASSIAALANTYGGWLFIGITDDGSGIPKAINGYSRS